MEHQVPPRKNRRQAHQLLLVSRVIPQLLVAKPLASKTSLITPLKISPSNKCRRESRRKINLRRSIQSRRNWTRKVIRLFQVRKLAKKVKRISINHTLGRILHQEVKTRVKLRHLMPVALSSRMLETPALLREI